MGPKGAGIESRYKSRHLQPIAVSLYRVVGNPANKTAEGSRAAVDATGEESRKEMQQLLDKDVAAFNAMLREKNIANILVKAP